MSTGWWPRKIHCPNCNYEGYAKSEGPGLSGLDHFTCSVLCIVLVLALVHNRRIVLLLSPIKAVETNLLYTWVGISDAFVSQKIGEELKEVPETMKCLGRGLIIPAG